MDGKELLQKHVVVEGHRDVYEQLYRTSIGEAMPIRDAIAPRLIRDGINLSVYAISGDSYSHSQNTGRYLETALENIDRIYSKDQALAQCRHWLDEHLPGGERISVSSNAEAARRGGGRSR